MRKLRIEIPDRISSELLFLNRHRCCICHMPRKAVQIHHIDENPANNDMRNLAVLCVDCHSIVSGNQGFGKNYSRKEISLFKKHWEEQCTTWRQDFEDSEDESDIDEEDEDEDIEAIDTLFKDMLVRGDEHFTYSIRLEEDNLIVYGISSDEPINFMIMRRSEYKKWIENSGECNMLVEDEDMYQTSDSFIVPKDGWYVIVACNYSDDDARVQLDISIWP